MRNSAGKAAYYKAAVVYGYSPPTPDKRLRDLEGDRISFKGLVDPADDSYTLGQARQFVNFYPVGKPVAVYYSPHDPQKSVLQPGTDRGTFAGSVMGFALSLLGALIIRRFRATPNDPAKGLFSP